MPLTSEQQENWGQQVDEVLALASIYGDDFRLMGGEGLNAQLLSAISSGGGSINGSSGSGGSYIDDLPSCQPPEGPWALDACISVQLDPPGGRLFLQLPQQGEASAESQAADSRSDAAGEGPSEGVAGDGSGGFSVRYLPPINVSLRLHSQYPMSQPPTLLELSALWLSHKQAASLRQALQQLWDEQGPGLPVCFTWADWLQSSALQHLGGAEVLAVEGCGDPSAAAALAAGFDSSVGVGGGGASGGGSRGGEREDGEDGQQADSPDQVLFKLLRYDAAREHQEFQRATHVCQICFEEQPGTSFLRLDCRHHFCCACLREQCHIHVREGSLEALKCPQPKCGAALSPQVLQRVLPAEEFARWEQLMLQKTLDRMADAAYCPRCSTVSIEDSDNCAQCPKCFFVFCSLCNEGWHPGVQCVSAETRLQMLQRKMAGGGATSVQELRRREEEMKSLAVIEGMSKRCPRCSMAIQKAEGCNKITCGNCGAYFCFKCNKEIRGYEHFKNGECILFDEAEILRWEAQWEDAMARVALGEARNDFFGQQQLEMFGGGRGGRERIPGCHCPTCGQINYKIGNNNHMCCWACTSHFCYLCHQALRGKGGSHFGPKGCRQHTAN